MQINSLYTFWYNYSTKEILRCIKIECYMTFSYICFLLITAFLLLITAFLFWALWVFLFLFMFTPCSCFVVVRWLADFWLGLPPPEGTVALFTAWYNVTFGMKFSTCYWKVYTVLLFKIVYETKIDLILRVVSTYHRILRLFINFCPILCKNVLTAQLNESRKRQQLTILPIHFSNFFFCTQYAAESWHLTTCVYECVFYTYIGSLLFTVHRINEYTPIWINIKYVFS